MEEIEEEELENENFEPLVTSPNPTERMLARRLRIQRRVAALRKQREALYNTTSENLAILKDEERTPIDIQIEKSTELLEKLLIEGEEYVTNVRIASEAREADRRESEGINKEKLLEELETEAASAESMFNEIADKWSGILKYNDPLHINEDILSQKEKCDELIKQKDALIATLREKLRKEERNFGRDQEKQIEDVNAIARRIENQIMVMRKAYRQEMQMIEEVILAERQLLIEANNKKWDELAKKRDQEEKNNSDQRSEDYWNFVKDMDNLHKNFQELFRSTTIQLENDCDELQRELERMKVEALMNSEKLDYNYQILKKREDENRIINSQQKRRINKLQDIINLLRKKIQDYHQQTSQQIEKLTEEIKKLSQNVLDIEKKADHMAKVNDLKFKKIWKMNQEKAENLFKKVLEIDRILHEQQLGLVWFPPNNEKLSITDLESFRFGLSFKNNDPTIKKQEPSQNELEQSKFQNGSISHTYEKTLKQILIAIADKAGFLIEDQLIHILEPYLEHQQNLVKVDNVFTALSVTDKNDIDNLLEFFYPYMYCPICTVPNDNVVNASAEESIMRIHDMDRLSLLDLSSQESRSKEQSETTGDILQSAGIKSAEPEGTVIECGPMAITLFDDGLKGECRGPEGVTHVAGKEATLTADSHETFSSRGMERAVCQFNHSLVISPVYVLKALKEFLAKYHLPLPSVPTMSARLSYRRSTVSRMISPEDIDIYWEQYQKIFPKEREQLWDGLLEGLKKYHFLLKNRKTTSEEVVSLREQNTELRRIFANYIDPDDIPYPM